MLVLLGTFFLLLILKMPIGFVLFISSISYMLVNGLPLSLSVQRIVAGVDSFPLLAVPGFILAGAIMNTGGITQRIFHFARKCVGHHVGGLAHANVMASMIFAGMSGSAVADAGGLGAIELKAMKEAGFDEDFSLAVTGSSSIIGPIIPPSIPAVIYGVTAGVSIGRLFAAGVVPGILMAGAISVLIYIQSKKRNYPRDKKATLKEIGTAFLDALFPLLAPILLVSGILFGIFTPTEASIFAVMYAIILSVYFKSITFKGLIDMLQETFSTTITVMLIISSASLFGYVLSIAQVPQMAGEFFIEIFTNKFIAILVINLFLIAIGMFMESTAAIMILVPVFLPIMTALGVDPVHFGIIMILNLMIGLSTPPVGMVLFVLSAVSKVPFEKIVKAMIPYIVALVIVLFIVSFFPSISMTIPNLLYGEG